MHPQKAALQLIQDSGKGTGLSPRTIAALIRKNQIQETESGYSLTKRGIARLEGRLGNIGNLERQISLMRDSKKATAKRAGGGKIARSRTDQAKDRKTHESGLGAYNERLKAATDRAMFRVLGGRKQARAMKISKSSGDLFTFQDVDGLIESGWQVTGTATAPAKPGAGELAGHQDMFTNPAPLGPMGTSRALIVLGLVDAGTIHAFRRAGYDVSPAPKALREPAPVKNPGYGGRSRTENEVIKKSAEKALSWYGKDGLVNATKVLRGFDFPQSFVDAGTITAIEYESDKFDGTERLFRHDVTKKRRMLISADGSTIIVWPPFKITKRGIEG